MGEVFGQVCRDWGGMLWIGLGWMVVVLGSN